MRFKTTRSRAPLGAVAAMSLWAAACTTSPVPLAGVWDATVDVSGVSVPFQFEIAGSGLSTEGRFFDGDLKMPSTDGRIDGPTLHLIFGQYATTLDATLQGDGSLDGRYNRGSRGFYPFHARRSSPKPSENVVAPSIAGIWTIPTTSTKGEEAWRFIVRQSGAAVSAAILRVDGDTGALVGTYANGKFVLSHFSGARPLLLEVTPVDDGTLRLLQNGRTTFTAVRDNDPRVKSRPTDPTRHTTIKDPSVPLAFSFPDLDGRIVTQADARFQGKVVIVNVTGSWCPNCHDEAPFLSALSRRYRPLGLEVVALFFEEADQLHNPTRLKAFVKRYGIDYTVLLAGLPEELAAKIPQATNLNSFPTTFFLGRDGRVERVQAGFPSAASGEFHDQTKAEITSVVESLLAEPTPSS